jgi:hypothetical protein
MRGIYPGRNFVRRRVPLVHPARTARMPNVSKYRLTFDLDKTLPSARETGCRSILAGKRGFDSNSSMA